MCTCILTFIIVSHVRIYMVVLWFCHRHASAYNLVAGGEIMSVCGGGGGLGEKNGVKGGGHKYICYLGGGQGKYNRYTAFLPAPPPLLCIW